MTAPDFRKGLARAVIDDMTPREATTVLRKAFKPLPDGDFLAKLEAAAPVAVEVMYEHLEHGEPREQAEASRVIIGARIAAGKGKLSDSVGAGGESDDERLTQLRACLRAPDPVLLAALRAERGAVLAWIGGET